MRSGDRRDLRFLLRDLPRGHRRWLLAGSLLALLAALASIGLVAAASWLITASGLAGVAAALGAAVTLEIFAPGALIRFFAVTRTATRYLERLLVHEAIFRILARLRHRIFRDHARLSFPALSRLRDGPLLARLMSDVARLEHFHAGLLIPLLAALAGLMLLSAAIWLLTGWWAGLLSLASLLLALVAMYRFLHRDTPAEIRLAYAETAHRTRLNDLLSAHRELHFADPHNHKGKRLQRDAETLERLDAIQHCRARRLDAGLHLMFSLVLITLLAVGIHQDAHPAWLAMAVLGMLAAAGLFGGMGESLRRWGGTRVALRRTRATREEMPVVPPGLASGSGSAPAPEAHWQLHGVWLQRGLTDRPVLAGADLDIRPGDQVLISGESGAGKSRLARLLLGIEAPHRGQVLLDGRPVDEWPEQQRFACVCLLEQRSVILEGSLRYNLCLANPSLTDEELLEAMKGTGLGAGGLSLDEWIGEQSRPLSGGEARRVALIRVVLSKAPTIILDEAFRGLNHSDRQRVANWLTPHLAGRTVVYLDHQADGYPADLHHLRLEEF